jgi:hypothetical protein
MKKLFVTVVMAVSLLACNDNSSTKTDAVSDSSTTGNSPTTDTAVIAGKGTSANSMPATDMASTSNKEGSMTMKDGKMKIMKDGKWVPMDQQMTCTDGCKVKPDGEVVMKDGMKMMLKEGMTVDKDGHMMDEKGKMMDMMMGDDKKMSDIKKDSMKK